MHEVLRYNQALLPLSVEHGKLLQVSTSASTPFTSHTYEKNFDSTSVTELQEGQCYMVIFRSTTRFITVLSTRKRVRKMECEEIYVILWEM